jgi:hypothetical protein
MMHPTVLVPSFAEPRVSARLGLALAAGLGCGVCAYAGLYPRFDDGALRVLLAATSAPFAAAVVAYSVSATSAARAFGRAVLLAGVLGTASIIVPAGILSRHDGGQFVAACAFGGLFGAFTGVLYGLPLAVLASAGHGHVRARTHEGTDRAARAAGIWLAVMSLIGLVGTRLLDKAVMDWPGQTMTDASLLPTIVASSAILAGVVVAVRASLRLRRRNHWLERVRAGLEPAFRVRVVDMRDPVAALPRLGEGETVVELVLDETSGAAYRVAAMGTAVALVSDSR